MSGFVGSSSAARWHSGAVSCLLLLSAVPAVVFTTAASACNPSVSEQAKQTAIEVGFDASALAASGFDVTSVGTLLSRLDAVPQSLADFETAKALVTAASAQLEQSRQAAQDGNQTAAEQIPTLETSLTNATAALGALRTALRDVALHDEPPAKVAALANVDAVRKRRVPVEFTVTERTKESWDAIESAVRREARCARTGESLDTEMATLLAAVRAEAAVVAAGSALTANRAAIESQLTGG